VEVLRLGSLVRRVRREMVRERMSSRRTPVVLDMEKTE
jgi:hypothetical protein